jgi:hypothetical protein
MASNDGTEATATWCLHCCKNCGNTLLERRSNPQARPIYECGSCSITAVGEPTSICGCGIMPKPILAVVGPRFRCRLNPDRSVGSPSLLVITFDEIANISLATSTVA